MSAVSFIKDASAVLKQIPIKLAGAPAARALKTILDELPVQQPLQMVGNRSGYHYTEASSGGSPGALSRTKHKLFGNPDSIHLLYAGWDLRTAKEAITPIGAYRVISASVAAGGSGHALNDVITLTATGAATTTSPTVVKLRVLGISGGAITKVGIVNRGVYDAPLADGAAQASTTGSGISSTFNLEWEGVQGLIRVGVEPDFSATQTASGSTAARAATVGIIPDGARDLDIIPKPGQLILTDPIPIKIGTNSPSNVGLRIWTRGPSMPRGRQTVANSEYYSTSTTDATLTGANLAAQVTQGAFLAPIAILGRPTKRQNSIVVISHSIAQAVYNAGTGIGDQGDADGHTGWFERSVAGLYPYSSFARSGDNTSDFISTVTGFGSSMRFEALKLMRPRMVIVDLSVNDNQNLYSTMTEREKVLVQLLRGIGVEYVGTCTTTPQTSSTDNWATTGNQTKLDAGARDVYTQARNTAVRAGTHPAGYDFLIDWGASVESTVGSGLWKPNVPGDNTHPKQDWHAGDGMTIARAAIQAVMPTNL